MSREQSEHMERILQPRQLKVSAVCSLAFPHTEDSVHLDLWILSDDTYGQNTDLPDILLSVRSEIRLQFPGNSLIFFEAT